MINAAGRILLRRQAGFFQHDLILSQPKRSFGISPQYRRIIHQSFSSLLLGRQSFRYPLENRVQKRYFTKQRAKECMEKAWNCTGSFFGSSGFKNMGIFLGGVGALLAGFGVDKVSRSFFKESKSAEFLGLKDAGLFVDRSENEQAKDYKETESSLRIIGMTGNHVLYEGIKGHPNPIRKVIEYLLENNREVNMIIYSKDLLSRANPKSSDSSDREDTIAIVKKWMKDGKYPNLHIREISEIPAFHGDLIDNRKAIIAPIPRIGIRSADVALIETYDDSGKKLDHIKQEFKILWASAKIPSELETS